MRALKTDVEMERECPACFECEAGRKKSELSAFNDRQECCLEVLEASSQAEHRNGAKPKPGLDCPTSKGDETPEKTVNANQELVCLGVEQP